MKQEKMYKVAVRKKAAPDDFFWKHDDYQFIECEIDCFDRYWLADPFLLEKDGVTYIFYEAMDLVTKLGKIGYSIVKEDGTCTPVKIVIDQKYHMSFPFIFEYEGNVYIMPESCGDWRVRLFKAKRFPDIWEPAEILLPDVYACDSIFIEKDGERWLLTNEMYHHPPVDSFGSCWVKNFLYPMKGLAVCGEGVKVTEGDFGIRNAGKSFWDGGKLYRIGQDCRYKQYGRGMALFEVESMTPYKEKMLWNVDCEDFYKHLVVTDKHEIIGVHTYNSTEKYEIVDFSQVRPVGQSVRFKRVTQHINSFILPFLHKA